MKKASESNLVRLLFKHKLLLYYIIIFIIFLFFLFISKWYNVDVLIALFLIIILTYLFCKRSYLFIKYFFSFFYCIFFLTGLFLCNHFNVDLIELGTTSNYNGSFIIGTFYFLLVFGSLFFFDYYFSKKNKYFLSEKYTRFSKRYGIIIYFLVFIFGFILFLSVINNPSFILNVDRFQYNKLFLSSVQLKLQNIFIYFVPLLIIPMISQKIHKNIIKYCFSIFVSLLPFFLYGFWTGNKFGLFFNILILLLSPISFYIGKRKLKINKLENICFNSDEINSSNNIYIKIFCIAVGVILVILIPYYVLRSMNLKDSLFTRISQQGQLWWATYDLGKTDDHYEIKDELLPMLDALKRKKVRKTYGVYKIMKLTTPIELYNKKIESGSRYSAQGIEIAYYYFGYPGVVIHAILRGLIEALLVNLLIKYVMSMRIFETMFISKLIISCHAIFTQGDLYIMCTYGTILCVLGLIIMELIYNKYFVVRYQKV